MSFLHLTLVPTVVANLAEGWHQKQLKFGLCVYNQARNSFRPWKRFLTRPLNPLVSTARYHGSSCGFHGAQRPGIITGTAPRSFWTCGAVGDVGSGCCSSSSGGNDPARVAEEDGESGSQSSRTSGAHTNVSVRVRRAGFRSPIATGYATTDQPTLGGTEWERKKGDTGVVVFRDRSAPYSKPYLDLSACER